MPSNFWPLAGAFILLFAAAFVVCVLILQASPLVATSIFCLLIILACTWLYCVFDKAAKQLISELGRGVEAFNKLEGHPEELDAIRESLNSTEEGAASIIREPAKAFLRNVQTREDLGWDPTLAGTNSLCSLKSPRDYLNEESLYLRRINDGFYQAVPGALTGLGILGTFIGLAYGITVALSSGGFSMGDQAQAVSSLKALLSGAGQAFYTSIVGIVLSLTFSRNYHIRQQEILSRIEALNESIERSIETLSPEMLLAGIGRASERQLHHTQKLSEEWQLQLKNFITKALEAQDARNSEYVERVVASVAKIEDGITLMSQNQAAQVGSLIEGAVKNFSKDLQNGVVEVTNSFAKSAEGVTASVKALDGVIDGISGQMAQASETVSETMTSMQRSVADLQSSVSENGSRLIESVTELEARIAEDAKRLGDGIEAAADRLSASAESLGASAAGTTEAADKFRASVAESGETFGTAVRESGESFGAAVAKASEKLGESVSAAGEGLGNGITAAGSILSASVTSASTSLVSSAEAAGSSLGEATRKAGDLVVEKIHSVLPAFDKAASAVGGAAELTESVKHLLDQANAAQGRIAEVSDRFVTIAGDMTSISSAIQSAGQGIGQAVESGIESIGATQQKASSELQAALGRMLEQVSQIRGVQEGLTQNAEQLQEITRENLNALAEALQSIQVQLGNNLKQADDGLGQAVRQLSGAVDEWVANRRAEGKLVDERIAELRKDFTRLDAVRADIVKSAKVAASAAADRSTDKAAS